MTQSWLIIFESLVDKCFSKCPVGEVPNNVIALSSNAGIHSARKNLNGHAVVACGRFVDLKSNIERVKLQVKVTKS